MKTTAKCTSCRAPIVWCLTDKRKAMPVDAQTDVDGEFAVWTDRRGETRATHVRSIPAEKLGQFASRRHRSHFATCPHAKQHSRGGKKGAETWPPGR